MRTGRVSHVYYALYYFRCFFLRNSLTTFAFILRELYFEITGLQVTNRVNYDITRDITAVMVHNESILSCIHDAALV